MRLQPNPNNLSPRWFAPAQPDLHAKCDLNLSPRQTPVASVLKRTLCGVMLERNAHNTCLRGIVAQMACTDASISLKGRGWHASLYIPSGTAGSKMVCPFCRNPKNSEAPVVKDSPKGNKQVPSKHDTTGWTGIQNVRSNGGWGRLLR